MDDFGLITFISLIAIVPLFFSDYSAFNFQEKKRMKWLSLCPFGVSLCIAGYVWCAMTCLFGS